jgi:O-acetyl-ADP-ribose deacetylase
MTKVYTIESDITTLNVDVIVNAANKGMLGGGGVDGAIHRAAGPKLLAACEQFPDNNGVRVSTGGVRITPAFDLPSKFIIHTAGPVWQDNKSNACCIDLANCYYRSLRLAELHGESVAFPAISTGIYGFPINLACKIAEEQIKRVITNSNLDVILLVTYRSPEVSDCYKHIPSWI